METSPKLMTHHTISSKALTWYHQNKRDLPWRKNTNPYSIWLSEIIMQQTRIEQGTSYYLKIINALPTIKNMALCEEEEILFLWKGLGYYSRARNLHHTAKHILENYDGVFPDKYNDIISLKGIGPYTASAISSIAFNKKHAAVDGNIARIVSRLMSINDISGTQLIKKAQEFMDNWIPASSPGDFNQAMMELGSLICKPKQALCDSCPLIKHCKANAQGIQNSLPLPKPKTKIRNRYFNFLLILDKNNNCIIEKRTENDIWNSLYQFPLIETSRLTSYIGMQNTILNLPVLEDVKGTEIIGQSKVFKHILSHQHIFAKLILIKVDTLKPIEGSEKIHIDNLGIYPTPRLIEKLMEDEWILPYTNS